MSRIAKRPTCAVCVAGKDRKMESKEKTKQPNKPHSLKAAEKFKMLLVMIKK